MDTDELMALCNALEVPNEELNKPFSIWRFDTLNIRGVDNLTSTDIYDYFGPIHPHSVEWLSNICCNVTFDSETRACNALQAVATGLIIHKNASPTSGKTLPSLENLSLDLEVFSSDTLEIPVPPNYRYILGSSHSKAKSIILRFATINDKKITSTSELEKPPGIITYKPKGAVAALNATPRRTRGRTSDSMDLRTKVVRNASAFKMSMRADEEEAQQLASNRRNSSLKSRTGNLKSSDLRNRLESRSGRGAQALLKDRLRDRVGPVGRSNDGFSNGVVKNKNNIWRRNVGGTHAKQVARNDLREVLSNSKNSMVRVKVSYDDDMLVD